MFNFFKRNRNVSEEQSVFRIRADWKIKCKKPYYLIDRKYPSGVLLELTKRLTLEEYKRILKEEVDKAQYASVEELRFCRDYMYTIPLLFDTEQDAEMYIRDELKKMSDEEEARRKRTSFMNANPSRNVPPFKTPGL